MILGVLPMAALAEETTTKPVVSLTADKTSVVAGQEVTLTLNLSGDVSGKVNIWEWDIIYDSAYFEITGAKAGDAAQSAYPDDPDMAVVPIVNPNPKTKEVTGTYVYASVTSGNENIPHYLKAGTIATLTLKAKEDIAEDISSKFYFVPILVQNGKGTALDVVDADAATNWGKADFLAGKMPADTVGLSVDVKKPLEPIDITVYYSDNGTIVTGKDGTLLNYAPVTVTDVNGDGKFTMYDGFACFHDKYHVNGAAGYEDNNWVTKFWSQNTAMVSYGHNNGWVYSTAEEIADGDSLCLFTYQDQTSWSDLFTYFDSVTGTATALEETTFHVNGYSFFGSGNIGGELVHATAAPVGATVTATCEGQDALTTTVDANGDFKLTFPAAGEWTVRVSGTCSYTCDAGYYAGQTYTNAPMAPAQMTVTVAENPNPPAPTPDAVQVYVYYSQGNPPAIVTGKDNTLLNYVPLTVTDKNGDKALTIDDAFLALHEIYYEGENGYSRDDKTYTFWGDTGLTMVMRNKSFKDGENMVSGTTAISDGDMITVLRKCPGNFPQARFDGGIAGLTATVKAGERATFHITGYRTDGELTISDATVTATSADGEVVVNGTNDAQGNVTVEFVRPGTYILVVGGNATVNGQQNLPIHPAQMTVTVEENTVQTPDPIEVSMYYATSNAGIVAGKDGTVLNYVTVKVSDVDKDGKLTIDDAFTALHETYYEGGAAGYSRDGETYTFWGAAMGNPWIDRNDAVATGATEIQAGDRICAISDYHNLAAHICFTDGVTGTATALEETTFATAAYRRGQKVTVMTVQTVTATCGDTTVNGTYSNGVVTITFPGAGTYTLQISGSGVVNNQQGVPLVPARMMVTVNAAETPEPPVTEGGYTVTLDATKTVIVDETVSINVTVGHTDEKVTSYNAVDMTFSYDADVLALSSTSIKGYTVTHNEEAHTVRVQGYGDEKAIGSVAFALTFQAKTTGSAKVEVHSAKVDISANAISNDAPEAVKTVGTTNVTVSGYPVTLPEDFTGAATAEPGRDYTFTAKDTNYNYNFEGTTVGGEPANVVNNGDGTFTIKNVTGAIVVKSQKTGKTFDVTLGTDMSGEKTAQYMTAYTATLNERDGFTYKVSVTIGGKDYTGYTVSGGTYTIPGADITGNIVFTVTRTAQSGRTFSVKFEGTGAGDATGNAYVTPGASYSFTLNKVDGYDYDVTATMGGETASYTEADGTYTFEQVTGDLVITITKTLHLEVEVAEYVELDGKTAALITANATLGKDQALSYDGTAMFWSDSYNAWSYLVIVDGEILPTAEEAAAKITATQTKYTTLSATNDVNASGNVDINDAQLVYDIYNGKYQDFTTVTMQKFLNADVNNDRKVDVSDAAAVVAAIQ